MRFEGLRGHFVLELRSSRLVKLAVGVITTERAVMPFCLAVEGVEVDGRIDGGSILRRTSEL